MQTLELIEDEEEQETCDYSDFSLTVLELSNAFVELTDLYAKAIEKLAEYESKKCSCCGGIKD
jgi:hypothetical protein